MKIFLRILLAIVITALGLGLVVKYIPEQESSPIDYACEAMDSPEEELGPAGIAYRGRLTEYDIVVGRTEINIVEFVNKRGEHCMLAVRNGEIQMICENH